MMREQRHFGLAEPPEAVIRGESVPPENPDADTYESEVDELVGMMKAMPAFQGYSDQELRRKAAERIKRLHDNENNR